MAGSRQSRPVRRHGDPRYRAIDGPHYNYDRSHITLYRSNIGHWSRPHRIEIAYMNRRLELTSKKSLF
jgi:hypothetical protein